jgi:methylenetetrahydrofolate dehydrogenase (NADP+) / methenyltetrahydrofolate cyclohydrolase
MPTGDNEISGSEILRAVQAALESYRSVIAPTGKRVAIIRFEPAASAPPDWRSRMEAARISADQKTRAFTHLGLRVEQVVLPAAAADADLIGVIDRFNLDPDVTGVIVQFPPPPRLRQFVQRITPTKDLDALLEDRYPYLACATAEGIWRVAAPFVGDRPTVAVVGARGFVGRGVVGCSASTVCARSSWISLMTSPGCATPRC